jgi:hypothetical protein
MGLRRLPDAPNDPWTKPACHSTEHNPPNMMVFRPGRYQWTCPSCGHVTTFTVPGFTL